jgi:nitrate reductase delta subunit
MTPEQSVLDALAALVSYPRAEIHDAVRACAAALHKTCPQAGEEIERFDYAVAETPLHVLQDVYVAAFDFDPGCSLELGWHLFGESHDRGAFMASIRERLEGLDIAETEGLPDHLANLLRLLAREEPARAGPLAERIAPALAHVRAELKARRSFYHHLLAAVDLTVASLCTGRPEAAPS